uniref:Uncharacterized protein n=1 Tax=Arundo donax TaxID=35708 RepID=A0A0A9BZE9_ARUDO
MSCFWHHHWRHTNAGKVSSW